MRLELETRRFYLGRDYSEAIEAAGGVPLHLALIPEQDFVVRAVEQLDGILLPGSDTDVDPAHYGEEPHPSLKRVVPEKDATDSLVIDEAERLGLPVLAICYGMQALNVVRGGSLVQDIDAQVEGSLKHEQGSPLERPSHSIVIEAGSMLQEFAGGLSELRVNSHHHQSVRHLGSHLRPAAKAKDGVIEAVEDTRGDRFVLGVQWHPEMGWREDALSRSIFDSFVKACGRRQNVAG